MKIAIIGAGNVGGALAGGWVRAGHSVMFGVRDATKPDVAALLGELGPGAQAADTAQAAAFGEVVVVTTHWAAVQSAVQAAGDLRGKILIDCTNPLKRDLSGLDIAADTSAGEEIARWAPGARVVKCFNSTGAQNMENPAYGQDRAVMLLAGDDAAAKEVVRKLGEDLGFEMIDAGPLTAARLLESLAMLWIHLAYRQGLGRDFAFKLMRR